MNDERPIEKLLRRYAKTRRDDAGPARQLHPATRRLLQGEAARQFPKPKSKEKSGFDVFVAAFARRWIYAVGAIVVLAVSAVIISPALSKKKSPNQLALNEPRSETLAAIAPAANSYATNRAAAFGIVAGEVVTNSISYDSALITADARLDSLSVSSTRGDKGFSGGGNLRSPAIAPAAQVPRSIVASVAATSATAKREMGHMVVSDGVAKRSASPEPTASAELAYNISKGSVANVLVRDKTPLARGGALEKDSQQFYRQSFSNEQPVVAVKAKLLSTKLGSTTPVLENFQIEQSGSQLRVIDADGSTYHGEISATQTESQKQIAGYKADGKEVIALGVAYQSQLPDSYQFRVQGTNITLNQQVVFAWNCVPFTNALALSNASFVASELKKQDGAKMPQQFPGFQNSYINGRAQVASEKEIEINARPVSP